MFKSIFALICIASFVFASSDIPELHNTDDLSQLSDKPEKLEKDNPAELSDSPDRNEEQREELVSIYSVAPQQETLTLPGMLLSISDMPDSNDMICSVEPPHLLLFRSKD